MKNFIKTTTAFCLAALGMLSLMSCEGADLYKVNAPDWLADMELEEEELNIVEVMPSPEVLGETDNSTPWWTVFTDDIKAEPGMTYQVKFINYGGNSNYKNYLVVLRNEAKNVEYAVLRADNWGWGTGYSGDDSDAHFTKTITDGGKKVTSDSRDWPTWLKAMSMAKCTATIANYGNGKCDVKISMLGADNVTYTQEYTDISVDQDDLYFSFTCEGSHLEFGDFDVEDSEPTAIELNGIPKKVLLGTTEEEVLVNLKATVTFGEGVTKDVETSDLQIMTIPDMNSLGTKTVVAVYNKTFLGNSATTPVIGQAVFEVVETLTTFTCIGATDNSTAFWGAHSEKVKVNPKETFVTTFTNYSSCDNNYNNFVVVLTAGSDQPEYAVLRADYWGWGTGWTNDDLAKKCTPSTEDGRDWTAWKNAMNGAKVTISVTNHGDGTADVQCVMVGNDNKTYKQDYMGINTITDANDFYFHLTVDHSHIVFDDIIGDESNTGNFWSAHSPMFKIPVGYTHTRQFTNNSLAQENYQNFLVVLTSSTGQPEYGVLRADYWGWGTGWTNDDLANKCTPSVEDGRNWDTFKTDMDGSKVRVSVTNNGTTADVKCVMTSTEGKLLNQNYTGLNTINGEDLNVHFTVDHCHLIFE